MPPANTSYSVLKGLYILTGFLFESRNVQLGPQSEAKVKAVLFGAEGLDLALNLDRAVKRQRAGSSAASRHPIAG